MRQLPPISGTPRSNWRAGSSEQRRAPNLQRLHEESSLILGRGLAAERETWARKKKKRAAIANSAVPKISRQIFFPLLTRDRSGGSNMVEPIQNDVQLA